MTERCLLLFGYGGHARSVADVALRAGFSRLRFYDSNALPNETFLGHPVLNQLPEHLDSSWSCFATAGDGRQRAEQITLIESRRWPIATLISPLASVGAGAEVATGVFIGNHAHVGPMAIIRTGALINTGAIVEHDCSIGEFTHISVNTTIAGRSRVGDFCFIGAGATIIDSITIGSNVLIAAGAVVTTSIEVPGKYAGVPAKKIDKTSNDSS